MRGVCFRPYELSLTPLGGKIEPTTPADPDMCALVQCAHTHTHTQNKYEKLFFKKSMLATVFNQSLDDSVS